MPAYIEIMHDQACGVAPVDPVELGLQILSPLVGELEVVRDTRQIKVTDPNLDTVRADKIRWPQIMPANFTIVLTSRELVTADNVASKSGERVLKKLAGIAFIGRDVAIIGTKSRRDTDVSMTVAHEVAHLYEVLSDNASTNNHCTDDTCIMYPDGGDYETVQSIDRSSRIKRMKSRFGRHEMVGVELPKISKFCAPCEVDLMKQSTVMSTRLAMKMMRNFK